MASKSTNTFPDGQQTISSFFSKKRKSSPIDLTASNDLGKSELPPPVKRIKNGTMKPSSSSSLRDDSGSLETSTTTPPLLKAPAQSPSKRHVSFPSSADDAVSNNIGQGSEKREGKRKGRDTSIPLRDKLRVRDMIEKDRRVSPSATAESSDGFATLHDGFKTQMASYSAIDLEGSPAEDNSLPWEKGTSSRQTRKASSVIGPAGLPCTPLEEAVIQFKKKYSDMVLLIEVGYKYCFFGDDAKIAGQVLGFYYGMDRNFLRTSCPVHNPKVNIKKLVAAGYKVGVISQVETAALKKVSDNRNALFERQLTQLYTPSTFVDDLDSPDDFGSATRSLVSIVEEPRGGLGPDDKVLIGIISVAPSTGDVIYDEFSDTLLRTELETRLTHLRPCELIIPRNLSTPTMKMLRHFADHGHSGRIRVEEIEHQFTYSEGFDYISDFHVNQSNQIVSAITDLPQLVVVVLALTLKHLSAFGLSDPLLQIKFFHKFATHAHMLLDSSTIKNLELFRNQTDFTDRGTLFTVLNHTTTSFGKRLLKSWVSRPLIDKELLQQRLDAVEETRVGNSSKLTLLRGLLKGLPDLGRGLCSIQYRRCTPKELATFLAAMNRVASTFPAFSRVADVDCSSTLWRDIIFALPALQIPLKDILASISLPRARDNNKTNLWTDPGKFPAMENAQLAIMAVEGDLAEELKKIRKLLRMPSLKYVNNLNDEFLIEVPKERASNIPTKWVRMGSTKSVKRFHTPEIKQLLQEREQHKETLQVEADKAYKSYLQDIAQYYTSFRDAVNKLATADCLMSLATFSLHGDVCKPSFVDELSLSIVDGRHPIIEQVRSEPYVPNSISLGGNAPRHIVVSGPNMGGKSSVVKLVALLVLMAQIGSYVPAKGMSLSMHDAILTRMGASDDLAAGRSTFMVEVTETCGIIKSATPKSLVVLDELGVGTSTFDGMAIAGAVLEFLCQEIKCHSLFITHYPTLARELELRYPRDIGNKHMSFIKDTRIDGRRDIRFLYQLTEGISENSFGIECARLAGIPDQLLKDATLKAAAMEELMEKRARHANAKNILRLLRNCILADRLDDTTLHEITTYRGIMGL